MHDRRVEIWNWLILRLLNQQKLLFEIIIQDRDFQNFFAGRFVRWPAMAQKGIERAGWHLRAFAFDFEMAHKPNSSKSSLFLNWLIFKPSKNFVTGKLGHFRNKDRECDFDPFKIKFKCRHVSITSFENFLSNLRIRPIFPILENLDKVASAASISICNNSK